MLVHNSFSSPGVLTAQTFSAQCGGFAQRNLSHSERYFLFKGKTLEIFLERYLLWSEKGLLIMKLDSLEGIWQFLGAPGLRAGDGC